MILERVFIRSSWSGLLFLLGFAGFSSLLLIKSGYPSRGRFKSYFHHLCSGNLSIPQSPSIMTVFEGDGKGVYIASETGFIAYLLFDTCEIQSATFVTLPPWLIIVTGILLTLQACVDFLLRGCTRESAAAIRRYSDEKILMTVSASFCVCVLIVDVALCLFIGKDQQAFMHDSVLLLLLGLAEAFPGLKTMIDFQQIMLTIWCTAFIIGLFRLLLMASIHPRLSLFNETLHKGFVEIFYSFSILSVIFVLFGMFAFLLFSEESRDFRTAGFALWAQLNMILSQWPFDNMFSINNQSGVYLYTVCFGFAVTFVVLRVYLAIVIEAFDESQERINANTAHMSVIRDCWLLLQEFWYGNMQKWPTRKEMIQSISADPEFNQGIPVRFLPVARFYENHIPELLGGNDHVEEELRKALNDYKQYKSFRATASSIGDDPYLIALISFRKALERVDRRLKLGIKTKRKKKAKGKPKTTPSIIVVSERQPD
jgi:hypothetical protein